MVRYSVAGSIIRPASSISTFPPAMASWNAAIPPAAPEPTTMTSYGSRPGVTVGCGGVAERTIGMSTSEGCGLRRLPAVRALLAVLGLAADKLGEELVALVAQLLMDPDLRRVVAADGRVLDGAEELLGRRLRVALVPAQVGEQFLDLRGRELDERRRVARLGRLLEGRQALRPVLLHVVGRLAEQQVDVVDDTRGAGAGRVVVRRDDGLRERVDRRMLLACQDEQRRRGVGALEGLEGLRSLRGQQWQEGGGAEAGAERLERAAAAHAGRGRWRQRRLRGARAAPSRNPPARAGGATRRPRLPSCRWHWRPSLPETPAARRPHAAARPTAPRGRARRRPSPRCR